MDVQTGTCEEDKPSGRIFHRLETILSPHEPAYNFHYAVTQFEEQNGLIGRGAPMNKVGFKREWREWIDRKYGIDAYERKIRRLRREHLERIEPDEIELVNGTAQYNGAVGPDAVVVDHLIRTARPGQRVLNFGCGAADRNGGVPHSVRLEQEGLEVTNHDIGDHADDADPDALHGRYDIVMASNVLHVLPSWTALAKTLADISSATEHDGVAVMNYPRHPPSFMGTTPEQARLTIEIYFKHVCVAPIKTDGPVFEAFFPH
ncbi:MAG TPA: methyltransferase domain-containing protein [Verrucomicrobiae bacterium]